MPKNWIGILAVGLLAILAAGGSSTLCLADDAAPATPAATPSASPPAASPSGPVTGSPTQPVSADQTPNSSAPAAPTPGTAPQPPAAPGATPPAAPSDAATPDSSKKAEGSTGETVALAQRPFAYIEGKADRDEVYGAIQGSLGLVKRDMDKAGLKPAGRPIAVFIESDDTGFRYRAGYPLEAAADGKTSLSDAVKIAVTPSGKAMRFQHLGSYADIDATYDAITAYLDEKGIDAQDSFVEEYANDVKDPDDPNLEVDIYVLLK
jgi:effector-binding domain-containing protein